MDLNELLQKAKNMPEWQIERGLHEIIIKNYRYQNLNAENQKLIMGLIKKYMYYFRKGIKVSEATLRAERDRLYRDRIKLNLTDEDLKDIKEIISFFQK